MYEVEFNQRCIINYSYCTCYVLHLSLSAHFAAVVFVVVVVVFVVIVVVRQASKSDANSVEDQAGQKTPEVRISSELSGELVGIDCKFWAKIDVKVRRAACCLFVCLFVSSCLCVRCGHSNQCPCFGSI